MNERFLPSRSLFLTHNDRLRKATAKRGVLAASAHVSSRLAVMPRKKLKPLKAAAMDGGGTNTSEEDSVEMPVGGADVTADEDARVEQTVSSGDTGETVQLTDSKIQQLHDRIRALEGSNARLRRRTENMRNEEASLLQHNEELAHQIQRLQSTLDTQQARHKKKDPLRLRLAGPVENFADRTGEKWPKFRKERRRPFPGVGQETGAAVDALKQILSQIFESVSDAWDFFNTSLTAHLSRAELRRGIQRLKIKNLDPDHILADLDRKPDDGVHQARFIEAFDWQRSPRLSNKENSVESNVSLGTSRDNKQRIDTAVREALGKNDEGWDAMVYMSKFKAVRQERRDAQQQYDPSKLIEIIEPQDVRLLSAREKFMIRSMRPPESGRFRPQKKGEKPWADRLSSPGWKNDPELEDAEARALRLEHERSVELQRGRTNSAKSASFKLDLSGLTSPLLPESLTFTSRPSTKVKVIKPQHKLTDGFAFSEDGDHVRRLMREHEAIVTDRRPIMSAVTADHLWLKQSAILTAVQRNQGAKDREKERYDLDGRCWPANAGSTNGSIEADKTQDMEASVDAAVKSGDRAELEAIIKKRQERSTSQLSARDPYDHASPANIAYMQVQETAKSGIGSLPDPKTDPALKVSEHV